VQINDGKSAFYQVVNSTLSTKTDYLLPWYLNEKGGKWVEATQCMEAGSNSTVVFPKKGDLLLTLRKAGRRIRRLSMVV
jgi:hypothetical protein